MKYQIVTLFSVLLLSGCATAQPAAKAVKHKATITIDTAKDDKTVITFVAPEKESMTFKSGDTEATYSRQTQSLLSRILSGVTLGVVGAKK